MNIFPFGALLTGIGASVIVVTAIVGRRWLRPHGEPSVRRLVGLQCVVIALASLYLGATVMMGSWTSAAWAGALVVLLTWSVRNRCRRQHHSAS